MINKIKFFVVMLFISLTTVDGQDITISLYRGVGGVPNSYSYQLDSAIDSVKSFTGIADSIEQYKILKIDLQQEQGLFERQLKRQLSEDDSANIKNLNTNSLSKKTTKHQLHVLSGFTCQSNKQIAIVDANMNYDFSDDILIDFNDSYASNSNRNVLVNYEFSNNGIFISTFLAELKPFSKQLIEMYQNENEDKNARYYLTLICNEHRKGTFELSNKRYNIFINSGAFQFGAFNKYDFVIQEYGKSVTSVDYSYKNTLSQNDNILIDGVYFKPIVSALGNSLILKRIKK